MTEPVNLINYFKDQWRFVRELTLDLLVALPNECLIEPPSPQLSPLWKHFRHIGRVQEDYIRGLALKKIDFNTDLGTFSGEPKQQELVTYLKKLDDRLFKVIAGLDSSADFRIDWFGELKTIGQHLMYLSDHEVLHHGQFVVYQKLQGWQFPKSWATWGL